MLADSVVWIAIVNSESTKVIGDALQRTMYIVDLFRAEEFIAKTRVLGRVVTRIVIDTTTSEFLGSTRVGIFKLVEVRTFKDAVTCPTLRLKAYAVIAPWGCGVQSAAIVASVWQKLSSGSKQ